MSIPRLKYSAKSSELKTPGDGKSGTAAAPFQMDSRFNYSEVQSSVI